MELLLTSRTAQQQVTGSRMRDKFTREKLRASMPELVREMLKQTLIMREMSVMTGFLAFLKVCENTLHEHEIVSVNAYFSGNHCLLEMSGFLIRQLVIIWKRLIQKQVGKC
jgi:hypothetical protein